MKTCSCGRKFEPQKDFHRLCKSCARIEFGVGGSQFRRDSAAAEVGEFDHDTHQYWSEYFGEDHWG